MFVVKLIDTSYMNIKIMCGKYLLMTQQETFEPRTGHASLEVCKWLALYSPSELDI